MQNQLPEQSFNQQNANIQQPNSNELQLPTNPNFQQNIHHNTINQNFSQLTNQNYQHLPPAQQISANTSFQQQFTNQSIQRQPSNQIYQLPSNTNFLNDQSNPNFLNGQSNPNLQQQPSNPIYQQSSNPNFQQYSSPKLQPQNSTFSHQSSEIARPTRGFPIIYDGFTFVVDPVCLCQASQKFNEIIGPFMNDFTQLKEHHLIVYGNQFTKRNMNNFLRICQKLPTDVQNSEMKEICEIAKMFKAEEIYNKGLAFVQANQDPSFIVPDTKYDGLDGIQYLRTECEANLIQHSADVSDEYFEDANNKSYQGNYYRINNDNENINNDQSNQNGLNNNQVHVSNNDENKDENKNSCQEENNSKQSTDDLKSEHSVVYQVRFESHTFKCPLYKFVRDNQIIYTAKQKYNEVFIGQGPEIHIRNKESHVGYILQNETTKGNKVRIGDDVFEVRYVGSGCVNHYSIETTFDNKGKTLSWIPKQPRYDPKTDKYYLNFHGEYHHTPILSSRNMVLQNKSHQTTFIVRKMTQNVFEIECLPDVEPLKAFIIGLSDIIGPYLDPWANNGTDLL